MQLGSTEVSPLGLVLFQLLLSMVVSDLLIELDSMGFTLGDA